MLARMLAAPALPVESDRGDDNHHDDHVECNPKPCARGSPCPCTSTVALAAFVSSLAPCPNAVGNAGDQGNRHARTWRNIAGFSMARGFSRAPRAASSTIATGGNAASKAPTAASSRRSARGDEPRPGGPALTRHRCTDPSRDASRRCHRPEHRLDQGGRRRRIPGQPSHAPRCLGALLRRGQCGEKRRDAERRRRSNRQDGLAGTAAPRRAPVRPPKPVTLAVSAWHEAEIDAVSIDLRRAHRRPEPKPQG
jgi:hypothetical protein